MGFLFYSSFCGLGFVVNFGFLMLVELGMVV